MMSENSSFSNFISLQKNITKRRRWLVILAFLVFILYNAVYLSIHLSAAGSAHSYRTEVVSGLLGDTGLNFLITIVGAVLLGIEGFSWLDSKVKLDFYESQPVRRNTHFLGVLINSTIIYAASYLVSLVIAFIIAGAGNAMSGSVLTEALAAFGQNLCLYFSIFSFSTLAVMLTGNLIVAVIADAVLLSYEILFDTCVNACLRFLATAPGDSIFSTHGIFSPLSTIRWYMKPVFGVCHNLFSGAVVLLIAWLFYRVRKSEFAGITVPYRAVRYITKAAVVFICALLSAVVLSASVNTDDSALCIIIMIISAIVVGCIMEAIYHSDVKAAFRGFGYTCIGLAAAVALFFGCSFDIAGYNKWVPDAGDVKSAYITLENEYGRKDYSKKYMQITDISSVNTLLSIGEENMDHWTRYSSDLADDSIYMTIYYRMKNGSVKGRYIAVPSSCKDTLNRLLKSSEFKSGWFGFYHDKSFTQHTGNYMIAYTNNDFEDSETKTASNGDTVLYDKIKEAYLKDLEGYDFDLAGYHVPVGFIRIQQFKPGHNGEYDDTNYSTDYPVYASFTNTINVLKSNDMYMEPLDAQTVLSYNTSPFYIATGARH